MIKYSLQCRDGHRFESWFADADAYDALARAGHLSCALCGSSDVEKSIMAPRIGSGAAAAGGDAPPASPARPLAEAHSAAEKALRALREKVERESEDVGRDFARTARAIHEGEEPNRWIRGEAGAREARALVEDGIPIAPLPFLPARKTN